MSKTLMMYGDLPKTKQNQVQVKVGELISSIDSSRSNQQNIVASSGRRRDMNQKHEFIVPTHTNQSLSIAHRYCQICTRTSAHECTILL